MADCEMGGWDKGTGEHTQVLSALAVSVLRVGTEFSSYLSPQL